MTDTNSSGKDVVYVDVDDEITGIIDKVTSANAKVVALVLPKRATMLQSIVNMKLLKKRADVAKKHVVLITSEQGLLPLAGSAGLHVASTLQSRPEVPNAPVAPSDAAEEAEEGFDTGKAGATAVGDLAGGSAPSVNDTPEDTVELDNSETPSSHAAKSPDGNINALAAAGGSGKAAKGKKGKNKGLKVPNFNRFRKLLILGIVVLILLIVGVIFALKVLPRATVAIKTNTSSINSSLPLTLDTTATAIDSNKGVVPAQTQQEQKSNTEQAPATGKKNLGQKASGAMTMTAQVCAPNLGSTPDDVPAGTGVSANGLTFITQSNASFRFSGGSGSCIDYASGSVDIAAQNGGSQYNVSNTSFTVSGRSDVSGSGSASGGTDNIVTVVQQADIDSAKTKLKGEQNADAVKQQLEQELSSNGLYPIDATFNASTPNVSSSVQPNTQASSVTVTESITYTMFGAKKSDIQQLLDGSINQQIDTSKQSIQNDGLTQSSFNVSNSGSGSSLQVSLQTTATIGPHIDLANLKTQIAGKRSGDVQSLIKAMPGVTDVQVHYSPFWVTSAPSNTNKITVKFVKSSSAQ